MPPFEVSDDLQTVERFLNLKIDNKEELQEIVELASEFCNTPMALITLMYNDTRYIKYKVGLNIRSIANKDTFCKFLTGDEQVMVVPDAIKDERFSHNDVVLNSTIRFYAGIPLITHDGFELGSLCVMGTEPADLTVSQQHLLKVLAKRVIDILELSFSVEVVKEQFNQAKDAEMKLRAFFESAGTCHLLIGKKLEVIAFNKNTADLIKSFFNVEVYAGQSVTAILGKELMDDFIKEYHKALTGNIVTYEREIIFDGDKMWWSIVLEPGYNKNGEIIGISYNATNITERKVHQQQILEQNETLMKIAHIQSHELRKPVASILGLVEIFRSNDYHSDPDELLMLARAAAELDQKIRSIVTLAE